jgi:hypothetical protein
MQFSCTAYEDASQIIARVQMLVNSSTAELKSFPQHADAVVHGKHPNSLNTLQNIQLQLACLPSQMKGAMRVLMLVMVQNRRDVMDDLKTTMSAVPADFSVYHYDCQSLQDFACETYSKQQWFRRRVVHRGIRGTGSGCILDALKGTIQWMLSGPSQGKYSHLWKVDSDLGFELFRWETFRALVEYSAPFICQPAILPQNWKKRATDRWSLRSSLGPYVVGPQDALPTLHVTGRGRLLGRAPPKDDVEIMCPFIDARILPAVAAAIEPMDTRNDVLASEALNTIARKHK